MKKKISLQDQPPRERLAVAEQLAKDVLVQLQTMFPKEQGYWYGFADEKNENCPFWKRIGVGRGLNFALELHLQTKNADFKDIEIGIVLVSKLTRTIGTVFGLLVYGLSSGLLFVNNSQKDWLLIAGLSVFILFPLCFAIRVPIIFCLQPLVQPGMKTARQILNDIRISPEAVGTQDEAVSRPREPSSQSLGGE